MHVVSTTMCDDDATTTKRWAPFSPPDEFDVVDAASFFSWVLATIWARGRAPGGRVEGVVGTLLIVELGSPGFLGKHDGCAVGRDNSAKKYGTPPNKVCLQTKSGSGNTILVSKFTRSVNTISTHKFYFPHNIQFPPVQSPVPYNLPHYPINCISDQINCI